MDISGFFKKFFSAFGKLFRSGLDGFLIREFENAMRIGTKLIDTGQFANTDAYFRALWSELRLRYSDEIKGTWLTIIAGYVLDALKSRGRL